ncbi:SurA N-terminal domain-containing protein [Candidatus Daviesbacteria bacterium]|nr:SurA N-terminal domain-containing protein [Candidatus Daviesbacteria bacterium]
MAKKVSPTSKINQPFASVNNLLDKISSVKNFRSSKKVYFVILVAGLLLLAVYKKSLFVAATVNGMPLTNLELQNKLNQQFRTQTLNQLINEKIILQEAQKSGAIPTETEISAKITELETSVGGKEALNTLLSQQGQTRDTLREQIRIQLSVTKLYESQATVSAQEVEKFLSENKSLLRATDSASQQKEAEESLQQQKLTEIFSQKFQDLRQKANINIF